MLLYACRVRVGRAAEKLEAAVLEMNSVATVVEATSQPMSRRDPLRKYMDIIYKEVPATSFLLTILTFPTIKWLACHHLLSTMLTMQFHLVR